MTKVNKSGFLSYFFDSKNNQTLKKISKIVECINNEESNLLSLSEQQLKNKLSELRESAAKGCLMPDILPLAFAVCREFSRRVMGMRHFDVQLMGGIVLCNGSVAEMKTGEGKTLVATLPAFLHSLYLQQVHIVTVNDYLAKRDAMIMAPLYEALGLKVGYLQSSMNFDERKKIHHENDVVYGTKNEFAFDYLRDGMARDKNDILIKKLSYAIIDEVDSILIDEARTPLIISGQGSLNTNDILLIKDIVESFNVNLTKEYNKEYESDFIDFDAVVSEKDKHVLITEKGFKKFEQVLCDKKIIIKNNDLYTHEHVYLIDMLSTMIKAYYLYSNHIDYIVFNGKIKIINQQTGRIENGKRWSFGLHQAVEAKESLEILPDNQSIASISLQNFYRLYDKISGMTGTADTESHELKDTYNIDVVVIPTNKKSIRKDLHDKMFLTKKDKFNAIINEIADTVRDNRPVLVGTSSVQESELISGMLTEKGLHHNVLNAKNHKREAEIIAQAGRPGAITIATNMAGRGTDIILGGNYSELCNSLNSPDEQCFLAIKASCINANKLVVDAGGLHVIGTTRNESRRVDNQLIGRSGRQGDPGSSVFYLSLEDDLMRLFCAERYMSLFKSLGVQNGDYITHRFIDKAILDSQAKISSTHYETRKELLKYDDIDNMQRKSIYDTRHEWLTASNLIDQSADVIRNATNSLINKFIPLESSTEEWDFIGLNSCLEYHWGIKCDFNNLNNYSAVELDNLKEKIHSNVYKEFNSIISSIGVDTANEVSKLIMIDILDLHWREQLNSLNYLRDGIGLRSYAQKNPIQEYSICAYDLFTQMIAVIQEDFTTMFFQKTNEIIKIIHE